uniref:Protein memo1 n=1 Tax=Echinococcus granulosus TaxID=6210 RepID=A0A068WDD3_ECHGR|nr:protein memo1 [Echinococcus granulosus]
MVRRCFEDLVSICHRERALTHDAHMYKENPRDLCLEVAGLLQLAPSLPSDEIRTIIVPNNALRYTGGIMAEAYAQICPINIKRIFVITPHERLVENRFLLSSCDCLMTSNYSIPVDKDISHEIWKTGSCEYISRLEDERNLGVEIQLPFITKIMEDHKENFTIIPIYVGLIEFKNISWFAMKLMPYFKDKTNLFIFSLSLTHWGSIYGFDKLNESKPTVLDTIKEHDICAIEALKTLNFKAFDLQISLAKTPLPDFPVWGIFLKLAQTLLNEEEYRCRKLPDAEFFKAYQEVGELKVHGLAWSLPDLTKDRSSISFVSASFRRYFKKCWTGPPNPCGEMDKSCP